MKDWKLLMKPKWTRFHKTSKSLDGSKADPHPLLAIAAVMTALAVMQLLASGVNGAEHEWQGFAYLGYFVPVAIAARYLSRRGALGTGAAAALVYTMAFLPHYLSMGPESHRSIAEMAGRAAILVTAATLLSSFRLGLASEKEKALKAERDRADRLKLMLEISEAVSSPLEINEVLQVLAEKMVTTVESTYCRVLLLSDRKNNIFLRVAAAYPIRKMEWETAVGSSLPLAKLPDYKKVIETGEAVILAESGSEALDSLPAEEKKLLSDAKYQLLYPLVVDGTAVGVICIGEQRRKERSDLDDEKKDLCRTIANIGAVAVDHALAHRALEEAFAGMVRSLGQAIDAKDGYTRGHSERVAQYAQETALRMGLDSETREVIECAGRLHDVGKIGISDAILGKTQRLTQTEWREVKKHPITSIRILAPASMSEAAKAAVFYHHERYDGKGYPQGLAGESIPVEGRILAVADAYEAMTSNRPYRRALSKAEAVVELKRGAGTQFDPAVVEAFLKGIGEAGQPAIVPAAS